MTSLKFGWRSVSRTPLRSLLFFVLIGLLCLLLALGSCVFRGVNDYLDQCREYYHSIAELEYLGSEYPDPHYYDGELASVIDQNAETFSTIAALDGVMSFQAEEVYLGFIPGVVRKDTKVYDRDAAIITVRIMTWDELQGSYVGTITECLYSREDHLGKMVFLRADETDLIKDHSYIFCGHYISGDSSYIWFDPGSMELEIDGEMVTLPAVSELDENGGRLDDYKAMASIIARNNNGFRVQVSGSLDDLRPWQQGELTLKEGRLFTEDECARKAKVCVIPSRVQSNGGFQVGDMIPISLNRTSAGIYDGVDPVEAPAEEYLITGIYTESAGIYDTIYACGTAGGQVSMTTGYNLGQYYLDNDLAPQFCAQAKELLPDNFRLNFYDEGYNAVAAPYKELRTMTVLFLAGCVLVALAVSVLFAYLFVLRNRETALTQLALGAGKKNVFLSFASGAAFVAIPALAVSVPVAFMLQNRILTFAESFAEKHNQGDYRYSSLFSSASKELAFEPVIPVSVFLIAALFLLVLLLAFVLIFSQIAASEKKPVRKKKTVRTPKGRTSTLSGRLKYALLSVRRGKMRTASVLVMGLVGALFLAALGASSESYREQLGSIKENTVIRAYATDYSGRQMDNIVMRLKTPQALWDAGLFEDIDVTVTMGNARVYGIVKTADGQERQLEEFVEPTGFAAETLRDQLSKEPLWLSSGSIAGTPLFYYEKEVMVRWYDGYDESCLADPSGSICVLPVSMMEREGIHLGDTVRFLYCNERFRQMSFELFDVVVAGQYVLPWGQEITFTNLQYTFPFTDDDEAPGKRFLEQNTVRSVILTLKDTADLDAARQAMEDAGVIQVRKSGAIRDYMILDDDEFLNSVQGIERQISYTDAVYTGLYVISFIIAFVASYLMIHSRRGEIALMRALGTPKGQICLTFILEQFFLVFSGLALGLLLWRSTRGTVPELAAKLSAVFAVCWMLGALLRLRKALNEKDTGLTEPE